MDNIETWYVVQRGQYVVIDADGYEVARGRTQRSACLKAYNIARKYKANVRIVERQECND
jgi:hypothetical protein